MKYIILLADGMADQPLAELGGLTPMARADKPHINALAGGGICGLCRTIPPGLAPGSEVANMAILGYPPQKFLRGRSALEALALGIELTDEDLTLRANLVTLSDGGAFGERRLLDYSGGNIGTAAAADLFARLAAELDDEQARLFAGNGFRGILRWRRASACSYQAAHDIMGQRLADNLPQGAGAEQAAAYMERAAAILAAAPYNQRRRAAGLPQANGLWLWGAGRRPKLPDFYELHGLHGAMMAGADLLKGLGLAAGLEVLELPTATGGVVTDFAGKGERAAAYLLAGGDFVFVHIEAPDEAAHQGDLAAKISAIERIDRETLPPILEALRAAGEDFRLLVMPDHATPVRLKTHTAEPTPFLLFDSRKHRPVDGGAFDERSAAAGQAGTIQADELLDLLLDRQNRQAAHIKRRGEIL